MSIKEKSYQNQKILDLLGQIYKAEMAGIHRYLHYSLMIMGHNRIPIQKWFKENAMESMNHATLIGEKITSLGGHPPIVTDVLTETNDHSINQLLTESLKHEDDALVLYKKLVKAAVEVDDIALEELARGMVKEETEHHDEIRKMLRKPDAP